jgi:hypothetical protein
LERAKRARLIDSSKKNIVWPALLEFIVHGLKYVYPAEPGAICRGVPTAHSALPLSKDIVSEANDQYVWPSGDGTVRGQAIEPLYKSVPYAVSKDPGLHQLLARERQIAADELRRRLHAA